MKKHFLAICIFSTLAFGFVACESSDDNNTQEQKIENFVGNWSGTFSGEDTGTWNIKVQETGKITGTFKSPVNDYELTIEGRVSENGALNATTHYGAMDVGTFNGTMKGSSASGIWTDTADGNMEGTWKGTKN